MNALPTRKLTTLLQSLTVVKCSAMGHGLQKIANLSIKLRYCLKRVKYGILLEVCVGDMFILLLHNVIMFINTWHKLVHCVLLCGNCDDWRLTDNG